MRKQLNDKEFYEVYGKYPAACEMMQAFKSVTTGENDKRFLRNIRSDRNSFERAYKTSKAIKLEQIKLEKERAKKWLLNYDLECFKHKGKPEYSDRRYEIVKFLREELEMDLKTIANLLSEILNIRMTNSGIRWIYKEYLK